MHREKELNELVERLKEAAGRNLNAVVLYGSGVDHEFHEGHSDLNILCLLNQAGGTAMSKLRPVGRWWWHKGHPAPLVFTIEELRHSADIFAIELLDIKQRHHMLLGEDFFADFDVPMALHRLQVERELRLAVVRLRQAFLRSHGRRSALAELMIASASTFATLFRHSLIALGEAPSVSHRGATDRFAALIGFDPAAFHTVLDLREGKKATKELSHDQSFAAYLDAVTRAAEEMDRLLAVKVTNSPKQTALAAS
jgi:hypothetical protein